MLDLLSLFLAFSSPTGAQGLAQHAYAAGERLSYVFEDTEGTFEADFEDGVLQPKSLTRFQELNIPFVIEIKKAPNGELERILRFQGGYYREGPPDEFGLKPARALFQAIPGFPKNFSYHYPTDAQAIPIAPQAYAPYMADPIGTFVYYKALDIHTIQSVIDKIPSSLRPGELLQKPAVDIPLPAGTFHNASTAVLYQKLEKCGAASCAFFKVITMGNVFAMKPDKGAPRTLYTNYQYTFYVPLKGPYTGLLYRGELQETVTVPPRTIIQRQLSMRLATAY